MKALIHYIEGHKGSTDQSLQAEKSFRKYGWDVSRIPGITPATVGSYDPSKFKPNGRLDNYFKEQNEKTFLTKLSCVRNHLRFWTEVVHSNTPMAFIEHDAICIESWNNHSFDEYLILNAQHTFRPPNVLANTPFRGYNFTGLGVCDLPKDYPLKYYKKNDWQGFNMAPGTGAYAITPKGAKRLLKVAEAFIDQSDFLINEKNVRMQCLMPSPVKFNTTNLKTSHGV